MEGVKKRTRAANYTVEEKELLMQLVKKYEYIINEKKLNSTIIKQKKEAWRIITKLFNQTISHVSRTSESLRKFYENTKTVRRRSQKVNGVAPVKPAIERDVSFDDIVVKEEPVNDLTIDPMELETDSESYSGKVLLHHLYLNNTC